MRATARSKSSCVMPRASPFFSRSRARDLEKKGEARGITQLDFDRAVALIYSTYSELLDQNHFTEEDAEQLRALWVLRGLIDERLVRLPWLRNVKLLIIDGFFDFTPRP